jgi:hypothetical protein
LEPLIIESPHVGGLMDVGQQRILIEQDAIKRGFLRFGQGLHDFIRGTEDLPPQEWADIAAHVLDEDPYAWASLVRANLLAVQASQNDPELKQRLTHLAAVVVAWLEDVNGRTPVGIEPER